MDARYVRDQLRGIERRLTRTDPGLAALLSGRPARVPVTRRRCFLAGLVCLGVECVVLGLLLALPLVFAGLLLLLVGAFLHATRHADRGRDG
ncbi:DUF3040 domain-containing protein [Saccharothrix sp. Mg75]|uniref:DUF3040 domain-containing protein n=1 Tax=Saccharothrix sp. Mg75 TaxID=3445357 RepID=UPI003EF079A6